MGNSKSLLIKLREKCDGEERESKTPNRAPNRSVRSGLWSCLKSGSSEKIDYSKDPEIQELHLKEIILGADACTLNEQRYWLTRMTRAQCYINQADTYVDGMFEKAEKLRAISFDPDDRWLANLMLAGLGDRFRGMIKQIEDYKEKITSEMVRWKILEHSRKRYFCCVCKRYKTDVMCPTMHYSSPEMTTEVRNGQLVKVFRNDY